MTYLCVSLGGVVPRCVGLLLNAKICGRQEKNASSCIFFTIRLAQTLNASINAGTLRAEMARKSRQPTATPVAPKRVSVNCTGFEKDLADACEITSREDHDLARIALRAVVAMILREKKLVTPLWLSMGEPPREVEV